MSNEVAVASSAVPDLAQTPSAQMTAADLPKKRIYMAQHSGAAVQSGTAKPGDIFVAQSADDEYPEILWSLPEAGKEAAEGVLIYPLTFVKGQSAQVGESLERFAFNDRNVPENAYPTTDYSFALPEVDTFLPYKLLFSRSSMKAAEKINEVVYKSAHKQPAWKSAFRLTCKPATNKMGKKYFVPIVVQVPIVKAHADDVEALAMLAATPAPTSRSYAEAPSI